MPITVCVRRNILDIHIPGSCRIVTPQMEKLKGKMITVIYDERRKAYEGAGWFWHAEWLKFKNNIDPNMEV